MLQLVLPKCSRHFCVTLLTTCLLLSRHVACDNNDNSTDEDETETTTTTTTNIITSPPTSSRISPQKEGKRFVLIAILDLGRNSVCNDHADDLAHHGLALEQGGQRLELVKWTLDKLFTNNNGDKTYELIVIDTCGNLSLASSRVISHAALYNLIPMPTLTSLTSLASLSRHLNGTEEENNCTSNSNFSGGFLLASVLSSQISVGTLGLLPTLPIHTPMQDERLEEQNAVVAMAQRLGWKKAIVISEDLTLMQNFGHYVARQFNLCLVQFIHLESNKTLGTSGGVQDEIFRSGVRNVILFGPNKNIVLSLMEAEALKEITWIVLTQGEMNWNFAKTSQPGKSIVGYSIERSFLRTPEFYREFRTSSSHANNSWEDIQSFAIARTLVNMAIAGSNPFPCSSNSTTSATTTTTKNVADDFEVRYKLGLTYEAPKFSIKALQSESNGNLQAIDIGQFTVKNGLDLNRNHSYLIDIWMSRIDVEACKNEEDCQCQNLTPLHTPSSFNLRWRFDTWVTVVVTIGTVGVVLTGCIAAYITGKACTEVLDGSQVLSIFFLFILMLMYAALIPYGLAANEVVCALRSAATRIVYSAAFAIMCTRSIMLATADTDGLPGHISGCLQTLLFVFMFGVQVALIIQEWFVRDHSSYVKPIFNVGAGIRCSDDGYPFLYNLSYVMLLLLIQLILSPFIVRSQRNYKEGLLFSVAALSCIFVWIGWMTSYILLADNLGSHWHDIAVCCGLVVTPTLINLIVFVPKCYLISAPSLYKSHATASSRGGCDSSVAFRGLDFSGAFSTTTSRLSPSEGLNLHGTTTTCSTTDDILLMEAQQQQNGHSSLHSDLYGSFKESSWKPVNRSQGGYHRPILHLVDSPIFEDPYSTADRRNGDNYPTYKLDRNSVVDTSIRWERYSYPSNSRQQPTQTSNNSCPPPPPPPPLPRSHSSQGKFAGTRL